MSLATLRPIASNLSHTEGTVGRWVQEFIDAEYLVKDFDKTKKDGPVKFIDGYGRPVQQYWAKINWEKVHDDEWGYDGY